MNQADKDFVRATLEAAMGEVNRSGNVCGATLNNLKVAVGKLEGKPDFVEDHPAHHQEK